METLKSKKIGFIGLGAMGFPLCYSLVQAGYTVYLPIWRYNSCLTHGYSPLVPNHEEKEAKYQWMLHNGGIGAASQKDMLESVDIVILCLPKSKQVEEVVEGQDGVLDTCKAGTIVIDMTSADYRSTKRLAASLKEKGMCMLDAPLGGNPKNAYEGTLAIMVGGDEELFTYCLPLFQTMGNPDKVTLCGGNGAAHLVKSCNNFLTTLNLAASAEALAVCAKAGVDVHVAAKVIGNASGSNTVLKERYPGIIFPGGPWNFTLGLMRKDVGLYASAAESLEVPTPLGKPTLDILDKGIEAFGDNADMTVIPDTEAKEAGVELYGIDKKDK